MKTRTKLLLAIFLVGLSAALGFRAALAAPPLVTADQSHRLKTNESTQFQQEPTPDQVASQEEIITFGQLGYQNQSLNGPVDSTDLYFSLPAHWTITGDVGLELDLNNFIGASVEGQADSTMSGTLAVYINDILVDESLLSEAGPVIKNLSLPQNAFLSQGLEGRHQLRFILHTAGACDSGLATGQQQPVVLVGSTSRLIVPYEAGQPPTNLGFFPRPIYQRSITPDRAVIVVPDEPSSSELQAALSVAAGLGNLTDRNLSLSLVNESGLTDQMRSKDHLIVVGRADNLALLTTVPLIVPRGAGGFTLPDAGPDDGIVQMVNSPWNDRNVLLIISGNSDQAVLQAGQATSTGHLQPGTPPGLSVVTAVRSSLVDERLPATDRSLQSLGYRAETLEGPGSDDVNYTFSIPPGFSPAGQPYLDLAFANSSQLDYLQSGVSILLNDDLIGSVALSDLSNSQAHNTIDIPGSALRTGLNDLKITARLIPNSPCLEGEDTWLVVQPETTIHLPLDPAGLRNSPMILAAFPEPFVSDQQLSDTTFVLPADDPVAWQMAAQLAFEMGEHVDVQMADLKVTLGETFPADRQQQSDIIMIGRPERLPLLQEIGNALPVNFEQGATALAQEHMPVAFQTAAGLNPGYLLLSKSPWNPDRAILAILSPGDQGIRNAGGALITHGLRDRLSGDFAIITDTDVQSSQVDRSDPEVEVNDEEVMAEEVTESMASVESQIDDLDPPSRPTWVLLALIVCLLLFVVILLTVIFPGQRQ